MDCSTAKEMWDILERLCIGSEEIKENKLSIACQKFDSFLMIKNESVEEMKYRFNQILNEVQSISKDKYTQREINLMILRVLPQGDWQIYSVAHQKTKKAGISDKDAPSGSKGAALKASSKDTKKQSKESSKLKPEEFFSQYALLTERFNKMETKFRKYKKFHKRNYKGKEKEFKPRYSNNKSEEKKSPTPELKDAECFGYGKKEHCRTDCPELSHSERIELHAKRDRKYGKKKAMVAGETEDSRSSTESTSNNSTNSDDESQAVMAKDAESVADNSCNSYDNRMNGPEVNSHSITLNTDNSFLFTGENSESKGSTIDEVDEYDQLMTDHRLLRSMFENLLPQNQKLEKEISEDQSKKETIKLYYPYENCLDELIMENNQLKTSVNTL
ncbi:uncharacterized protein LOC131005421 [Salvia miltiorrhiza]|uniref:uncharacterized protein LOC131005421 n=1 Tax=Salvia miltiorrhiza TaxID=226208 RepID=UPI0025ABD4C9|nr:uncharacterized protein LOC131005421 [Salvia miltiorrhiza]